MPAIPPRASLYCCCHPAVPAAVGQSLSHSAVPNSHLLRSATSGRPLLERRERLLLCSDASSTVNCNGSAEPESDSRSSRCLKSARRNRPQLAQKSLSLGQRATSPLFSTDPG